MPLTFVARRRRVWNARASKDHYESGFSLLELLIVVGIVSLLAAIATPQVLSYLGKGRTESAKAQIAAISAALEVYALDNGAYPSQRDGLQALLQRPPDARNWRGPYLRNAHALVDPWGVAYFYRMPGQRGAFDVFSLGRDRAPGGTGENQDVSN